MSIELKDFLTQSFSEFSFFWIIISAGFGGLIGAIIKYIFEQLISPATNYKRKAKQSLKRYSNPLLLSADSLVRCSELYLRNIDRNWINDEDDYFKMNILYCFGQYFSWCKIIEEKSFFELDASISRKSKRFIQKFYRVYKGLNSFYYFDDLIKENHELTSEVEKASIKRLHIQAIGELMIKDSQDSNEELPKILKFTEFVTLYKNDNSFKNWFEPVLYLLINVKKDINNLYWSRMSIFLINLQSFVNFYDPTSKITKKRSFYFLDFTNSSFEKKVLLELSNKEKKELLTAKPHSSQ